MNNKICHGYWRMEHQKQPIRDIVSILERYNINPEKINHQWSGVNICVSDNGYTADYFDRKIPSHHWNHERVATIYLDSCIEPRDKACHWIFQAQMTRNHSFLAGMTNCTSLGNEAPSGRYLSRNEYWIGFEFASRPREQYPINGLDDAIRFNTRSRGWDRDGASKGNWSHKRKEYHYTEIELDNDEMDIEDLSDYDSDTSEDFVYAQFKIVMHRSRDHLELKFYISEYPNKLYGVDDPVINGQSNSFYRINEFNKYNGFKKMGLAVTIPMGSVISLLHVDFGDSKYDDRFGASHVPAMKHI